MALKNRGSHVEGQEFDVDLAASTSTALENAGIQIPIQQVPKFEVRGEPKSFETVFIARLYLSYIHDQNRRIEFLKKVRKLLADDGVLIFGYFTRPEDPSENFARIFRFQPYVANFFRSLRGKSEEFPVETGDHLDPHIPLYHHHYIEKEVEEELEAAGFKTIEHGRSWFGWTAARAL